MHTNGIVPFSTHPYGSNAGTPELVTQETDYALNETDDGLICCGEDSPETLLPSQVRIQNGR
jgi:hypothetical protein